MVAMLSSSLVAPYMPDMPMQPSAKRGLVMRRNVALLGEEQAHEAEQQLEPLLLERGLLEDEAVHHLAVEDGDDAVDEHVEAIAERSGELGQKLVRQLADVLEVALGGRRQRFAQPRVGARRHEQLVPRLIQTRAAALAHQAHRQLERIALVAQRLELLAIARQDLRADILADGDHERLARR